MTQPLTSFWPIFAVKSDGHDVVNQKGKVVRNGRHKQMHVINADIH